MTRPSVDRVDPSDIELAHELADAATKAALPHVATTVKHVVKQDGTPVSQADWAAEAAMVDILRRARPHDGIVSEESGALASGRRRRWVLDPVDGTVQFVRGGDEWGTHVALEVDDEVVLGVITRPQRRRRWWAARGWGAFADADAAPTARSRALAVTSTASLEGARIGLYAGRTSEVPDVLTHVGAEIVTDSSHILDLVEGRIDAIVSHQCGFGWDHAPAIVLAAEAGGVYVDPDGGTSAWCQGGLYANARLMEPLGTALAAGGILLDGR